MRSISMVAALFFSVGAASIGCGDDTGAGGEAGAGAAGPSSGASLSQSGSSASQSGSSASSGSAGNGSCLGPTSISLPFSEPMGSTATALDVVAPDCSSEPSLPERVYELTLLTETTVTITANDSSGQGVGVQIRADDCQGTSVSCDWEANGNVDRTITLPAGKWVIIVERNPAGAFDFSIQ